MPYSSNQANARKVLRAEWPAVEAGIFLGSKAEQCIERQILAPMREQCAMALYGMGKIVGPSLERSEAELMQMTVCGDFPQGLDFSTDEGNARFVMYRLREDIQHHYGLYFVGLSGAGIQFTIHPLLGMQWREDEFRERAVSAAQQLARMWREGMRALGNKRPDGSEAITEWADRRVTLLTDADRVIRAGIVVELSSRPKTKKQEKKRRAGKRLAGAA